MAEKVVNIKICSPHQHYLGLISLSSEIHPENQFSLHPDIIFPEC